jgi:serine protease Do
MTVTHGVPRSEHGSGLVADHQTIAVRDSAATVETRPFRAISEPSAMSHGEPTQGALLGRMVSAADLKSRQRRLQSQQRGVIRLCGLAVVCCAMWVLPCQVGLAVDAPVPRVEVLEEQAYQQAAVLVAPSIVRIETIGGVEQLQPGVTAPDLGTGLIVSADGEILTSAFTIAAKPTSILVTLADGRRLPATVVATDYQRLITLLKVEATDLPTPVVAPAESIRVGQWVLAMGRTLDVEFPSVSVGVLSAKGRVWGKALQTDAKVSPVNYGGPLVDIQGRVLGVLTPLAAEGNDLVSGVEWYDSGIGFAVPMTDLVSLFDRLRAGSDLRPGLLGVTFRERNTPGSLAIIDRVRAGSPAGQAGLKSGDRVTRVDDQPVSRVTDFRTQLSRRYAGENINVVVDREGMSITAEMELVAELQPYRPAALGVLPERRTDARVVVRAVMPGSAAATAGLQPGDVLVDWQGQSITSTAFLREEIGRLLPKQQVVLGWERDGARASSNVELQEGSQEILSELIADVPETELPAPAGVQRGRFAGTLAGYDRDYWAFVPDAYRPTKPLGLLVMIAGKGEQIEARVLEAIQAECERRGLMVLSPAADSANGWGAHDAGLLRDLVAWARGEYQIDPLRIVLCSTPAAAPLNLVTCLTDPPVFRGCALVGPTVQGRVPENTPERQLAVLVFSADRGPSAPGGQLGRSVADRFRQAGFRTAERPLALGSDLLPARDGLQDLCRWIDALDQF